MIPSHGFMLSSPALLPSLYRAKPASTSARRDRDFEIGGIDGPGQGRIELVAVELALPPGDHDGGNAVARDVGQRATFAHELVDPEHDGHAGHQRRIDHGERRSE